MVMLILVILVIYYYINLHTHTHSQRQPHLADINYSPITSYYFDPKVTRGLVTSLGRKVRQSLSK